MERSEKLKKLFFYLLKLFLIVFVFASLIYISLHFYSSKKEKEVLSLWKSEGIDLIKKQAELMETKNNESADKLLNIAQKIAPKNNSQVCDVINSAAFAYLKEQLKRDHLEFIFPEESVSKRLNEIKEDLLKVSEIVKNEKPIWKRERTGADSSSYLLAIVDLTRLLSAETLYSLSQDKKDDALIFFKAAVSLADSLKPQSIIDSIILIACYRNIYGCAKFFPYLDEETEKKLSSFDPLECNKEGFICEAAGFGWHFEKESKEIGGNFFSYFYAKPYLKLEKSVYLKYYLMLIKAIEKEDPCNLSGKDVTEKITEKMPKWAIISKIAIPNFEDAWVRSYRLQIEKDITLMAHKAKYHKIQKGEFPESLDLKQSICPNTSYKYVKSGNNIKIFFDGNFKADEKTAFVPLSWEE